MHNEQINKDHTKYGILVTLAKERPSPLAICWFCFKNRPNCKCNGLPPSSSNGGRPLHLTGHNVPIKSRWIVYYVKRKARGTLVRGSCCGTQRWSSRSTIGNPDKATFTKVRTEVIVFEKALLSPQKNKRRPEARDLSWHERFPIQGSYKLVLVSPIM